MRKALNLLLFLLILAGCQKNNFELQLVESGNPLEVYFCPRDNCENELINTINKAQNFIHCAFFDIDLEKLINVLNKKSKTIDVKLVIDSDNYFNQTKSIPIILDNKNQLSHNKFCSRKESF